MKTKNILIATLFVLLAAIYCNGYARCPQDRTIKITCEYQSKSNSKNNKMRICYAYVPNVQTKYKIAAPECSIIDPRVADENMPHRHHNFLVLTKLQDICNKYCKANTDNLVGMRAAYGYDVGIKGEGVWIYERCLINRKWQKCPIPIPPLA